MNDDYPPATPRRNAPLIAMAVVGAILTLGGAIITFVASAAILKGAFNPSLGLMVTYTSSLAGLGVLLLVIAWTVAAARYK